MNILTEQKTGVGPVIRASQIRGHTTVVCFLVSEHFPAFRNVFTGRESKNIEDFQILKKRRLYCA